MLAGQKDPGALKTIGELSQELGIAQHILRYWETRFPQLRPMQRAGNRRYYRPEDVALARRINRLLNEEGYTVRGVQKLLRSGGGEEPAGAADLPRNVEEPAAPPVQAPPAQAFTPSPVQTAEEPVGQQAAGVDVFRLIALRDRLASALDG